MKTQFKRMLCLVLTAALTACASAPTHYVTEDKSGGYSLDMKALEDKLEPGEKVEILLEQQFRLEMEFSEVNDTGIVGWLERDHGYPVDESGRVTIPWEHIVGVKVESGQELSAGKILLAALIIVGVSALIVSSGGLVNMDSSVGSF